MMGEPNLNKPLGKYEKEVEDFMKVVLAKESTYFMYCLKITGNKDEAKDLLDEVVFKIFDNRHKYTSVDKLKKVWAKTVRHAHIDKYRKSNTKYTKAFWSNVKEEYRDRQGSIEDSDKVKNREIINFNASYILRNIDNYIKHDFNRFVFMEHLYSKKGFDEIAKELNSIEKNKNYTITNLRVSKNRGKKELFEAIEQKHPNFLTKKIILKEDE